MRVLHYSVVLFVAGLGIPWSARAQQSPVHPDTGTSPDARAMSLDDEAMNTHYAEAHFKAAVGALNRAILACGSKCSAKVTATLHRDLGIVLVIGMNDLRKGEAEFRKAVHADPTIALDPGLANDKARELFVKAGGARVAVVHSPVAAQKKGVPIPLFARVIGDAEPATVQVLYRKEGADTWRGLNMKKHGDGFAAIIPCEAVRERGRLEYFIRVRKGDEDLAASGSKEAPFAVELGDEPPNPVLALPDEDPPEACDGKPAASARLGTRARKKSRTLWGSVQLAQDVPIVGGDDICGATGQNNGFYCFRSDGQQYIGTPTPRALNTGVALGTTRILAAVDVVASSGVSVGAAAGYAFRGGPKPAGGSAFLPLHLEARIRIFVSGGAFSDQTGLFVSLGAGVAQVDSSREMPIAENPSAQVPPLQPDNPPRQRLQAWKKMGRGFLAPGLGAFFPVGRSGGVVANLDARVLFPATGFCLAPGVAYAVGF